MRGVVTLHIKQYGEYRLSVLNDRQEFMQIILTSSDPRYEDAESRNSRIKQCREYRLSAINNCEESIKNREYFLEVEEKFLKSLNTESGAWESICEKIGGKNLVGLSL